MNKPLVVFLCTTISDDAPPCHTRPPYNQPNVKLVDLRESPIERVTPTGVKMRDREV